MEEETVTDPEPEVYVVPPLLIVLLMELYESGWTEADEVGMRRWMEETEP